MGFHMYQSTEFEDICATNFKFKNPFLCLATGTAGKTIKETKQTELVLSKNDRQVRYLFIKRRYRVPDIGKIFNYLRNGHVV